LKQAYHFDFAESEFDKPETLMYKLKNTAATIRKMSNRRGNHGSKQAKANVLRVMVSLVEDGDVQMDSADEDDDPEEMDIEERDGLSSFQDALSDNSKMV
jgi:hypothetical protein